MSAVRPVPAAQQGPRRVLLVHNKLTSFVRLDRELLQTRFAVDELCVSGHSASPWAVWQAVRRVDAVLYWFASAHSLLPALGGRILGRPVIGIVGGYDTANLPQIGYGHQRGGVQRYVARAAMHLATQLVTNSRYTKEEAIREARMPAEKIAVVYHGVPPTPPASPETAREADLVLTVGNVDWPNLWRKGLEPFVRTAALLPRSRFVLVGAWKDDAITYLHSIATPNVTFTGAISDEELRDYLQRAGVYVQASAHEGFGLALAEAMMAGCAPVVTAAGALPEVVGDAGVYAPSAAPGDLALAIQQAQATAPALGAAARARILTEFPLHHRAQRFGTLLEAAIVGSAERGHSARPAVVGDTPRGLSPLSGAGNGVAETATSQADWPFVSVVIPTYNEEHDIGVCLQAVLGQDYPAPLIEILIVDGYSTDGTREAVQALAAADRWGRVRLLDNAAGLAAAGLNTGIRAARGEYIVRVDGHTVIAPDYLRRCAEALRESGADNVGGLMRPQGRGYVGQCIALATTSRFGIGNSRFHYDERGGEVETVYLGCFRRSILERVGLFDESLVRNQDDELNDRIISAGGRIWLSPAIRSVYYNRGSYRALWRQYAGYGYWKVRVLRRHRHALRMRHVAPAMLAASLAGSAMLGAALLLGAPGATRLRRPLGALALGVWLLYGGASALAAAVAAARGRWRLFPGLLPAFWCLHVGYGTGFLRGLLDARPGGPLAGGVPAIPSLEPLTSWGDQ